LENLKLLLCEKQCQENEKISYRLGENIYQRHNFLLYYPKYTKNPYNSKIRKHTT
jgi:hypothetical protein